MNVCDATCPNDEVLASWRAPLPPEAEAQLSTCPDCRHRWLALLEDAEPIVEEAVPAALLARVGDLGKDVKPDTATPPSPVVAGPWPRSISARRGTWLSMAAALVIGFGLAVLLVSMPETEPVPIDTEVIRSTEVLDPPTRLGAVIDGEVVELSWVAPSGAERFRILIVDERGDPMYETVMAGQADSRWIHRLTTDVFDDPTAIHYWYVQATFADGSTVMSAPTALPILEPR